MKRIPILLSALVLTASTSAFAQNNAKAPPTPAQGAGIGQANKSDPSASGANNASGGTLMQQREKGMSSEGASDAAGGKAATGKMKQ
jgi:hypothetical protein